MSSSRNRSCSSTQTTKQQRNSLEQSLCLSSPSSKLSSPLTTRRRRSLCFRYGPVLHVHQGMSVPFTSYCQPSLLPPPSSLLPPPSSLLPPPPLPPPLPSFLLLKLPSFPSPLSSPSFQSDRERRAHHLPWLHTDHQAPIQGGHSDHQGGCGWWVELVTIARFIHQCLCLRHLSTHAHMHPSPLPPFPPTHAGVCFQHLTLPSDHLNREPLLSVTAIQNGQDLSCCDGGCACTGEPCGSGRKGEVAFTSGAAGEDHFEGIIQGREVTYKGNHILASLNLRHPLRFPLLLVATFHLLAVSSPLCVVAPICTCKPFPPLWCHSHDESFRPSPVFLYFKLG